MGSIIGGGFIPGMFGRGGFTPSDVPQAEADALITLYDDGDGDNWTDNTGWKTDPVVGNWYGVTVAGGHVTKVEIGNNNGSGDISSFDPSALPNLTTLRLNDQSFSGDISGWSLPNSLAVLFLEDSSLSGDLSGWTLPDTLTHIYMKSANFSGDVSSWSIPSGLKKLYLRENSFSGDISVWTFPASLEAAHFGYNSFSGCPDLDACVNLWELQYWRNNLSQADVDAVLQAIYSNFADFTNATPELIIGDGHNNADPSGIYQDGDPPTTGKEYIFEVCTDPEGTGNNTWTITYNDGAGTTTKP